MLVLIDEYYNYNTSNLVDRVKLHNGDPRHFLAELKSETENTLSVEIQQFVFLHRMPYMKMNYWLRFKVNISLFILMILIAISYSWSFYLWDLTIALQTPFDIFIIPGCFFYFRYQEKREQDDVNLDNIIRNQTVKGKVEELKSKL